MFEVTDEAEAEMTAVLQENLTGIRVVRAFARQEYEIAKFAEKNADVPRPQLPVDPADGHLLGHRGFLLR